MLEKIKNLKWHFQLLLLVGVAGTDLFGASGTSSPADTRAEVRCLMTRSRSSRQRTKPPASRPSGSTNFVHSMPARPQEYEELKVLLPNSVRSRTCFRDCRTPPKDRRLIVMRFSPRDDTQQDSIMAKPVEVEVDSNFNNLRAFFDQMAKLPRIVSITDFKINQLEKQTDDKTIHAQFLLTAYYADPDATSNQTGCTRTRHTRCSPPQASPLLHPPASSACRQINNLALPTTVPREKKP